MIRKLLTEIIREPFTLSPIHGGDINEAFLVTGSDQDFFVKYHNGAYARDMFNKEKKGLELINKAVAGFAPESFAVINKGNHAVLLLEFIKSGNKSSCQSSLAEKLAQLHRTSSNKYGLDHDNYIGRLVQYNMKSDSVIDFLMYSRFEPQIKMAVDTGLIASDEVPDVNRIMQIMTDLIPDEGPCLVHGDLWGGNYLCTSFGSGMIIDPAVAYSHREMDIAMSMLFGGFTNTFYNVYNDHFPLVKGWENRLDLFQLYYLLVHLNLFGMSYKGSVLRIMKKDFG